VVHYGTDFMHVTRVSLIATNRCLETFNEKSKHYILNWKDYEISRPRIRSLMRLIILDIKKNCSGHNRKRWIFKVGRYEYEMVSC